MICLRAIDTNTNAVLRILIFVLVRSDGLYENRPPRERGESCEADPRKVPLRSSNVQNGKAVQKITRGTRTYGKTAF